MAWDKEFFSQGWNSFPHPPHPQHHVYICLMVSGFLKWLILKQFGLDFIIMVALPFLTKSCWEQQILKTYTKQPRMFQADYSFTFNKASVDFSKCWSRSQMKKKKKVGGKYVGGKKKGKRKAIILCPCSIMHRMLWPKIINRHKGWQLVIWLYDCTCKVSFIWSQNLIKMDNVWNVQSYLNYDQKKPRFNLGSKLYTGQSRWVWLLDEIQVISNSENL